jgi:hypothetical protein
MTYTLISIDEVLSNIETDVVNLLYDYHLLTKFTPDVKKIIMYFFIHEFNNRIKDSSVRFYHSHILSDSHELLKYYERDKLDKHINKICQKLKKLTGKLFFIKSNIKVPSKSSIDGLDGCIADELILSDYSESIDPRKLKEFLHDNNLGDMFSNLSKKLY